MHINVISANIKKMKKINVCLFIVLTDKYNTFLTFNMVIYYYSGYIDMYLTDLKNLLKEVYKITEAEASEIVSMAFTLDEKENNQWVCACSSCSPSLHVEQEKKTTDEESPPDAKRVKTSDIQDDDLQHVFGVHRQLITYTCFDPQTHIQWQKNVMIS